MAIDSAEKRMSAMTVGGIPGYVYPTGTIGQAARQDVVGVYRGLAAAEPSPAVPKRNFNAAKYVAAMTIVYRLALAAWLRSRRWHFQD